MSVQHGASVDDDVLARTLPITTFLVLARLDTDGIVTHIEGGVKDQHTVTGFEVKAITILGKPGVANGDIVDDKVFTHQRMNIPGWRIREGSILEQYALATDKVKQHRTIRHATHVGLIFHALQVILLGIRIPDTVHFNTAARSKRAPLAGSELAFFAGTPCLSLSIERTMARDGNVVHLIGIERSHLAGRGIALIDGGHFWIGIIVGGEEHKRTLLYMQINVRNKLNGTCEPDTTGNNEMATALLFQGLHGCSKGFGAESTSIALGSKVREINTVGRNIHSGHCRHLERCFSIPGSNVRCKRISLTLNLAGRQNKGQQGQKA